MHRRTTEQVTSAVNPHHHGTWLGWRSIFWFFLPFGAFAWIAVALALTLAQSVASSHLHGPVMAAALLLSRGRFWGRPLLNVLVHLPLILPPVVTGWLMGQLGAWAFFLVIAVLCFAVTGYAAYRMTQRAAPSVDETDSFTMVSMSASPLAVNFAAEYDYETAQDEPEDG